MSKLSKQMKTLAAGKKKYQHPNQTMIDWHKKKAIFHRKKADEAIYSDHPKAEQHHENHIEDAKYHEAMAKHFND